MNIGFKGRQIINPPGGAHMYWAGPGCENSNRMIMMMIMSLCKKTYSVIHSSGIKDQIMSITTPWTDVRCIHILDTVHYILGSWHGRH